MGERSQALADRFKAAHRELVETVENIPDDKWGVTCQNDERSVGVVAHHIGSSISTTFEAARMAGTGQPVPPMSREMIDSMNATHAMEHANCSKADALQVIRTNGEHVQRDLAQMPDDQLDREIHFPLIGADKVTVEKLIDALVIGHMQMHLPDIRATVS
jgi:hypothetical protein